MRKSIIIGLCCLLCGLGLIAEGIIFKVMSIPDLFKGIISGPIIIVFGLYFLLKANKRNSSTLLISSNLTFVLKYFVSTLLILMFIAFVLFFTFVEVNKEATTFAIIFGTLFLAGVVWSSIIYYKLVKVEYDGDSLFINENKIIPISEIKEIKRVLPILFKIVTKQSKSYWFVPHYFEVLKNGVNIPISIREIQKDMREKSKFNAQ
jgi:hypothetical protein